MCCACDTSEGKTFYNPKDGKWWWTSDYSEGRDFFETPIGYEDALAKKLLDFGKMEGFRWKVSVKNGNYRAVRSPV